MIARRQFLGFAAAGAVLGVAGCSACPGGRAAGATPRPRPAVVPAASAAQEFVTAGAVAAPGGKGPFTVAALLETPSFFVAHRGSGDNWPEHTMRAYKGAVAAGLKAIEVSVSATSDGVLVCHHDLNTQRLTGIDLTIARAPYAALEPLSNDARAWLGPATPLEPIALLTDVLDTFAASHVIFLEDKPGTNADEILALLENYPAAREHVVWKQPAASRGHDLAAAKGYTTFGYMVSRDQDKVPQLITRTDLLGIHHTAPESMIRQVVASGKPVLAWELHRRSEYARLRDLGVRGFICANIRYVLHQDPPLLEDGFAAGRRGTGDLPWAADAVWDGQPAFADGAISISSPDQTGYVLGSLAEAVDSPDREFEFELCWPSGPPAAGPGAGVAFGQDTDAPYRPGSAPKGSGYSLDVAADGTLALYRHDAGTTDPVRLAETGSPAPRAGEWMKFVVSLRPWSIGVRRDGGGTSGWSVSAEDSRYGGAWLTLLKNYDAGPPVEFRGVRVRAVAAQEGCGNVG
ncbi:glycerophosphodiester phosphodiesterase [Arthrobacter sp. NPDC058130]|uniref:glycerophosphodiester phosphodiesterase n=1 Tax=Arthrobacter sp. NPDC058130 TaxID=3346353 RepID=UPI0036E5002C